VIESASDAAQQVQREKAHVMQQQRRVQSTRVRQPQQTQSDGLLTRIRESHTRPSGATAGLALARSRTLSHLLNELVLFKLALHLSQEVDVAHEVQHLEVREWPAGRERRRHRRHRVRRRVRLAQKVEPRRGVSVNAVFLAAVLQLVLAARRRRRTHRGFSSNRKCHDDGEPAPVPAVLWRPPLRVCAPRVRRASFHVMVVLVARVCRPRPSRAFASP
jgi:hypothetical protein